MRTRLRAAFVVGYDGTDHVVYDGGDVVYEDDRIVFVGNDYRGPVDVAEDLGQALLCPGFVDLNALGDIDHAIFDTYQDATLQRGLAWSRDYAQTSAPVFDSADAAFMRRYAFGQLLMNGITTALPIASEIYTDWAESYDELVTAAQIADELGIRMYLGPSFREAVPVVDADGTPGEFRDRRRGREGMTSAVRFAAKFSGNAGRRIQGMLAPSRVETMSTELLVRTKAESDRLECPVRLHAGQTMAEVGRLATEFGRRPIEYLDAIGFLGPRTIIPHAWAVSGHSQMGSAAGVNADLDALRESGTTVVFCPMAIARYGVVLESFDRYIAHGIRVGMGTDTAPPDMIRAMDTGMVMTKTVERRKDAGQVRDLYRAATVEGANALGRSDLGRLATGAKADMIVVDLSEPRIGPIDDPIRTLVMNCNGRDVDRVIVDGVTVVKDGRLAAGDLDAARATEQLAAYRASYSDRDYLGRNGEELFPPTFARVRRSR